MHVVRPFQRVSYHPDKAGKPDSDSPPNLQHFPPCMQAVQPAAGKITSTSMPLTPKASMAAAKAAASTGAIAMITATPARTLSGIPTKTSATLLRGQSLSLTGSADCSTAWEGHVGGAGPVLRVLLGLPTTEDAVTVLEQFQVQVRG